jgi:hypothetical protein
MDEIGQPGKADVLEEWQVVDLGAMMSELVP